MFDKLGFYKLNRVAATGEAKDSALKKRKPPSKTTAIEKYH